MNDTLVANSSSASHVNTHSSSLPPWLPMLVTCRGSCFRLGKMALLGMLFWLLVSSQVYYNTSFAVDDSGEKVSLRLSGLQPGRRGWAL